MNAQELIAEARIQEALALGEEDRLPNKGQPLDLEGYFQTPETMRMAFSMLKGADVIPEEIELLHEINRLKSVLRTPGLDEAQMRSIHLRLAELHTVFDLKMRRYDQRM